MRHLRLTSPTCRMQAQPHGRPVRHDGPLERLVPVVVPVCTERVRAVPDARPGGAVEGVAHVGHPVRHQVLAPRVPRVVQGHAQVDGHALGAPRALHLGQDLGRSEVGGGWGSEKASCASFCLASLEKGVD